MCTSTAWSAALVVALSVLGQDAGKGAHEEAVLRLPDREWELRVSPAGFEFGPSRIAREGRTVWAAGDGAEPGLMVEITLEHTPDTRDAKGCLARAEPRLRLDSSAVSDVTRHEVAGYPVIEYEIREHRGVEVDQRNLHAYLYHDRACAEIHVSFVGYRGQPRSMLESAIRAIEIVDAGP
jgi:hypothetical protein